MSISVQTADAPAAVQDYIGYDWLIPISLTDDHGAPIDIDGWTLSGDLYLPGSSGAPVVLPAQNVDVDAAYFEVLVPSSVTKDVPAQKATDTAFPCRIMLHYSDATGEKIALRPVFMLPLDPRAAS